MSKPTEEQWEAARALVNTLSFVDCLEVGSDRGWVQIRARAAQAIADAVAAERERCAAICDNEADVCASIVDDPHTDNIREIYRHRYGEARFLAAAIRDNTRDPK